jgi:predicted DNA-binding transcriptional regulator AlpA
MSDVLPFRPPATDPAVPTTPMAPLLIDAKHLAESLSLGLRTVRAMNTTGKLPAPVRLGGRVVWRLAEVTDWVNAGCPDRTTWIAIRAARKT